MCRLTGCGSSLPSGGATVTTSGSSGSAAVHLTEHWEENEDQYLASISAYLFKCGKDARIRVLTSHPTFPAFVAFASGELRGIVLAMTTYIQGAQALVGYTSNLAKGSATTSIVSEDVGKSLLFIYNVSEGDVENINKKKRGAEFKSDTAAAVDIKDLLPTADATYVVYFEPLAFPVGPGQPVIKGEVTDFILS